MKLARLAIVASFAVLTIPSWAKMDLVTLPDRDATQVTIYNSQDLTLVTEKRQLSFAKGTNSIQFSWAGTRIDPTSPRLMLGDTPGLVLLDTVYPNNTRDLVNWTVEADDDVAVDASIRYFAAGLSWSPRYTIVADSEESSLCLQQYIRVRNRSCEDFEDANLRVVVGGVNLKETIAAIIAQWSVIPESKVTSSSDVNEVFESVPVSAPETFNGWITAATDRKILSLPGIEFDQVAPAEIARKAVSEYHLLAVEGTQSIRDGWSKELPNPEVCEIPFEIAYEWNPAKYGRTLVKLYKFKNDEEHELGRDPLPAGRYYVYRQDAADSMTFQGIAQHKYLPIGEDMELNLGADGLVLYEKTKMSAKRSDFQFGPEGEVEGWDETVEYHLEITNTRNRVVPVRIDETFEGSWNLESASVESEKLDSRTLRWEMKIPANEKQKIEVTVRTRYGSNADSK